MLTSKTVTAINDELDKYGFSAIKYSEREIAEEVYDDLDSSDCHTEAAHAIINARMDNFNNRPKNKNFSLLG